MRRVADARALAKLARDASKSLPVSGVPEAAALLATAREVQAWVSRSALALEVGAALDVVTPSHALPAVRECEPQPKAWAVLMTSVPKVGSQPDLSANTRDNATAEPRPGLTDSEPNPHNTNDGKQPPAHSLVNAVAKAATEGTAGVSAVVTNPTVTTAPVVTTPLEAAAATGASQRGAKAKRARPTKAKLQCVTHVARLLQLLDDARVLEVATLSSSALSFSCNVPECVGICARGLEHQSQSLIHAYV